MNLQNMASYVKYTEDSQNTITANNSNRQSLKLSPRTEYPIFKPNTRSLVQKILKNAQKVLFLLYLSSLI